MVWSVVPGVTGVALQPSDGPLAWAGIVVVVVAGRADDGRDVDESDVELEQPATATVMASMPAVNATSAVRRGDRMAQAPGAKSMTPPSLVPPKRMKP